MCHFVVRQGLVIGSPSYSLKKLEPLYMDARLGEITDAGSSIVEYERWLQTGEQKILDDIEAYNRDDVESTWRLRNWLEEHRKELVASGQEVVRPPPPRNAAASDAPSDASHRNGPPHRSPSRRCSTPRALPDSAAPPAPAPPTR